MFFLLQDGCISCMTIYMLYHNTSKGFGILGHAGFIPSTVAACNTSDGHVAKDVYVILHACGSVHM